MDRNLVGALSRIESLCTQFENSWIAGQQPEINELLEEVPVALRTRLLRELLLLEIDYLTQQGHPPKLYEYRRRFSLYDSVVCETFRDSAFLYHSAQESACQQSRPTEELGVFQTDSLKAGQPIERFVIERLLGEGTFSVAYLAYDSELDRHVCIKVPHHARAWSAHSMSMFSREARVIASLKHAGIVSVYDIAHHDGLPLIVMDYVQGGSLRERLSTRRLSVAESVQLIIQVAEAVDHAHQHGIIHRDLKPSNILMNAEDQPCVVDFGLALQKRQRWHHDEELAGTLSYMAPEQMAKKVHMIDARTDIWSLGVILYELLTDKLPFESSKNQELKHKIQNETFPSLCESRPNVPRCLERVCQKALAKEMNDRYRSALDMARELRRIQNTLNVSWANRPSTKYLSWAAVFIVLLCIVGFFTEQVRQQHSRSEASRLIQILLDDDLTKAEYHINQLQRHSKYARPIVEQMLSEPISQLDRDRQLRLRLALLRWDSRQIAPLVEALVEAEGQQFPVIFSALVDYRETLVPLLEAEWQTCSQNIGHREDSFPSDDIVEQIRATGGVITGRFALSQTMSLDRFHAIAKALKRLGYRPTRLRPFVAGEQVLAAAIWTRDGKVWQAASGLTRDELVERDRTWCSAGYRLIDVGGYVDNLQSTENKVRYCGLWCQSADSTPSRLLIGPLDGQYARFRQLVSQGYREMVYTSFQDRHGRTIGCSIWQKTSDCIARASYPFHHFENPGELSRFRGLQLDLSLGRSTSLVGRPAEYEAQRFFAQQWLQAFPEDSTAAWRLAEADFHLGDYQKVVEHVSAIVSKNPQLGFNAYSLRARAYAGLGKEKEAREDLARFHNQPSPETSVAFKRAAYTSWLVGSVEFLLGNDTNAIHGLNETIANHRKDPEFLFYSACAYCTAYRVHQKQGSIETAQRYLDRAFALLQAAVEEGFSNDLRLKVVPQLAPVRNRSDFEQLLTHSKVSLDYSGCWTIDDYSQSVFLRGFNTRSHQKEFRSLQAQGYQPHSIAVVPFTSPAKLVTASVWHRPTDLAIKRMVHLAIALARLQKPKYLWPLFQETNDPRIRSKLIDRCKWFGVNPQMLIQRLQIAKDSSAQSAIMLCLAGYQPHQISESTKDELLAWAQYAYLNDSDPGVHAASGWLLRSYDAEAEIASVEWISASQPLPIDRRWYTNSQGQDFSVISAPFKAYLVSPRQIPTRHGYTRFAPVSMGYRYAIGTSEVTVEQFRRFDSSVPDSRQNELPMLGISWYQAAAYCNWLSKQEGLPDDQLCYLTNSDGQYAAGMRLAKDCLHRSGYRLPTEFEWEFGCRAGVEFEHFFGESDELLINYGWYYPHADSKPHPVKSLMPNDFGLFDVYGNALEWCLNTSKPRWLRSPWLVPQEDQVVTNGQLRISRGGSYVLTSGSSRSGQRFSFLPHGQRSDHGFRLARTIFMPSEAPANTNDP